MESQVKKSRGGVSAQRTPVTELLRHLVEEAEPARVARVAAAPPKAA